LEKTIGGNVNKSYLLMDEGGYAKLRLVKGGSMTTIQSNSPLTVGSFSHVVGTWDGTTMKLYVNNVLQTQTATLAAPIDTGAGSESGMQKINFPAVSTMTGGGDDTTSPYAMTYNWTSASTATQSQFVTPYNNLGDTGPTYFYLYRDITAPSAFSLTAPGAGYV